MLGFLVPGGINTAPQPTVCWHANGLRWPTRSAASRSRPRAEMDRRSAVVALVAGALVVRTGFAQSRVRRIGILGLGSTARIVGPEPAAPDIAAFVQGMRDAGYVWGRDFVTVPRGSEGRPELYAKLAQELVGSGVDVIVAAGPTLLALREATRVVPVVMAASGDPVGQGLVDSLGRPGGNFTGLSLESVELTGKRLALIKQIAPGPAPIGVLWDASSRPYWNAAERVATRHGWSALGFELRNADDVGPALARARSAHAGALLVSAAGLLYPRAHDVATSALAAGLPTMFELRPFVEAGGLVSYGADINDMWRRAAGFVDRILKGARPPDLPVEQPTRFELVVNLKIAALLGVTVPQSVLLEANKVLR